MEPTEPSFTITLVMNAIFKGLFPVAVIVTGYLLFRYRRLTRRFTAVWVHAWRLPPTLLMPLRGKKENGYSAYYHSRPLDKETVKTLRKGKHLLITGPPLSGKTRALMHALKRLKQPASVLIPHPAKVSGEGFRIPPILSPFKPRRKILLLDGLERFAETPGFLHILSAALEKRTITIAATARSGAGLQAIRDRIKEELGEDLFAATIEIPALTAEEGVLITHKVKREGQLFDGRIGPLVMPLAETGERYRTLNEVDQTFMKGLKRMYHAGVMEGDGEFNAEKLRKILGQLEGLHARTADRAIWRALLAEMNGTGLVAVNGQTVQTETALFDEFVEGEYTGPEELTELAEAFPGDGMTQYEIATRMLDRAEESDRPVDYLQPAVRLLQAASEIPPFTAPPDAGELWANLGHGYLALAGFKDKEENRKRAGEAYHKALEFFPAHRYPFNHRAVKSAMERIDKNPDNRGGTEK